MKLAIATVMVASAILVIGCSKDEDVPYGGEVKTNPQGAEAMKNGETAKPMGMTPSTD